MQVYLYFCIFEKNQHMMATTAIYVSPWLVRFPVPLNYWFNSYNMFFSYLFQSTYDGNYSSICVSMACTVPGSTGESVEFILSLAWEGTSCGDGKVKHIINIITELNRNHF